MTHTEAGLKLGTGWSLQAGAMREHLWGGQGLSNSVSIFSFYLSSRIPLLWDFVEGSNELGSNHTHNIRYIFQFV